MVVSSLLRGRLGYRAWRALHWAAYACWPVALLHGMGTGTDIRLGWGTALNLVCLVGVLAAVWWRLSGAWGARAGDLRAGGDRRGRGVVVSATVASAVTPVAVVVWLFMGPLHPGWAKRAGTPSSHRSVTSASRATPAPAVRSAAGRAPPAATTSPTPSTPPLSTTTQLKGSLSQATGTDGQTMVTIDATLTVPAGMRLVIALKGDALTAGGIAMRSSQVTIGVPANPAEYRGTVSALVGQKLTLALSGPGDVPVVAVVRLIVAGGAVSGTIDKVS